MSGPEGRGSGSPAKCSCSSGSSNTGILSRKSPLGRRIRGRSSCVSPIAHPARAIVTSPEIMELKATASTCGYPNTCGAMKSHAPTLAMHHSFQRAKAESSDNPRKIINAPLIHELQIKPIPMGLVAVDACSIDRNHGETKIQTPTRAVPQSCQCSFFMRGLASSCRINNVSPCNVDDLDQDQRAVFQRLSVNRDIFMLDWP